MGRDPCAGLVVSKIERRDRPLGSVEFMASREPSDGTNGFRNTVAGTAAAWYPEIIRRHGRCLMGKDDVREALAELMENLGVLGLFMLKEVRTLLQKSWGSSREEFMASLDKVVRNMKQTGKWAAEDVERTASRIRQSWEIFDQQKDQDWDTFLAEVKKRLDTIGDVTRETFDLAVNQAKETLDKQWTAMGRLGEDQLKALQEQSESMATLFKQQWGVFRDNLEKTSKKIDRAVEAAWEELKKKD